jgi:hypothetical protein
MTSHVALRRADPNFKGREIFEITPILLGGDPVDPKNKAMLTRQQHIEAVRYWNNIVRELRAAPSVRPEAVTDPV